MVKRVQFGRGDVVMVNLEPTEGREQRGAARPALVLSTSVFNALGVVLVAPSRKAAILPATRALPRH